MTGFIPWIRPAAATRPPPPPKSQLVVLRVGVRVCAADVHAVERVLRYDPPRPVPGGPAWLVGAMDFGGGSIPVVDLRARLAVPPAPAAPHARIVVFAADGVRFAAIADDVREVATVLESAVVPVPAGSRRGARKFVRARVAYDGHDVDVLDVPRLMDRRDRKTVELAMVEDQ